MDIKVVYLNDTGIPFNQVEEYFANADAWATQQCSSYIDYYVQDVSDHSYVNDFVAQYGFDDPKDALLFRLKWQNN